MNGRDADAVALRWERLLAMPENDIVLAEGALLIAAERYPDLDIDHYLSMMHVMGSEVANRIGGDRGTKAVAALNGHLFGDLGYGPNRTAYYDPRNSYLNDVLDRRVGIPITLAVVYIAVAKAAGLPMEGVSFPGHFLVSMPVDDGLLVLDPYAGGASLDLDDLKGRLRALSVPEADLDDLLRRLIMPAGPREILARMLRNLRDIHRADALGLPMALAASDRIIQLAPAPEEFRERGRIYRAMECFRPALSDLERYLSERPDAVDSRAVRQEIAVLRKSVTLIQ